MFNLIRHRWTAISARLKQVSFLARHKNQIIAKKDILHSSLSFPLKSESHHHLLQVGRSAGATQANNELTIEEEAERKIGWLLKLIFAGTATAVAYQFFPYMGDTLLQQSVSLLHVKDPLFKRMGASRLSRFAIDDERRKKIVETGGAAELLNMLGTAKDDRTRKEALKALVALSPSDEAIGFLHRAGAVSVIRSIPDSSEYAEIETQKLNLLSRFQDLRLDSSS